MHWIKEVELVDSVDDLMSSSSMRNSNDEFWKYSMRGLFQHWTESSLILTSKEESVWRNKRPRSRSVSFAADRLLTWSVSTSGSLEPMILSRTMPTYSLFVFERRYSGIRFKVGRNFNISDENPTWYLGRIVQKLRIRESEKLKIVLELYDQEIHQKKLGPDYHRMKTMVKRKYRARCTK